MQQPNDQPNGEQFPPGYMDRFGAMQNAGAAASTAPLPGPLLEAFLPESIRVCGFELRQAVASDFALLQAIGSPILKEMSEQARPESERLPVAYQEEDLWELLYIWTRPIMEARATLRVRGRDGFREIALQQTGDRLPASVVTEKKDILQALALNLIRAFSTQLQHQPALAEGEARPLAAAPAPATASAGGSTT